MTLPVRYLIRSYKHLLIKRVNLDKKCLVNLAHSYRKHQNSTLTGNNQRTKTGLQYMPDKNTEAFLNGIRKNVEKERLSLKLALSVLYKIVDRYSKNYKEANNDVKMLRESKEMLKIFQLISESMPFLTGNEHSLILCASHILNIPHSSEFYITNSKNILEKINSFPTISVLHIFCNLNTIQRDENDKLLNSMYKACLLHMEISDIRRDIEFLKVGQLLFFLSHKGLPSNVAEILWENVFSKFDQIDTPSKSLLFFTSLYAVDYSEIIYKYYSTIKKIIDYIFENLTNWPKNYVLAFQKFLSPLPYDEKLLDAFAEKVIKEDINFNVVVNILKIFLKKQHLNCSLLDYCAEKFMSDETVVKNSSIFNSLVYILAKSSYYCSRTNYWDSVKDKISKLAPYTPCTIKTESFGDSKIIELFLCFDLFVMGVYKDELINETFSTNWTSFLPAEQVRMHVYECLLLLHQAVSLFYPNYQGPRLSENSLSDILLEYEKLKIERSDQLKEKCLETVLGGPNFFLKNGTTSLHHLLEYVTIFGPDDKPIDLLHIKNNISPDTRINVEKLDLPKDSKIVVLQEAASRFKNVDSFTGIYYLKKKILEHLGFISMSMDFKKANISSEEEKVLYLKNLFVRNGIQYK